MTGGFQNRAPIGVKVPAGGRGAGSDVAARGKAINAKRSNASPPGAKNHTCHCGVWGAFGFEDANGRMVWRCRDHREKLPKNGPPVDVPRREMVVFPKQGKMV